MWSNETHATRGRETMLESNEWESEDRLSLTGDGQQPPEPAEPNPFGSKGDSDRVTPDGGETGILISCYGCNFRLTSTKPCAFCARRICPDCGKEHGEERICDGCLETLISAWRVRGG